FVIVTETRSFRPLRVGDVVQEGDLLGLIDPALAEVDLRAKVARVEGAEAERVAAEKLRDESKSRYDAYLKAPPGTFSQEDIRGSLLNYQRWQQEEIAKRAAVAVAVTDALAADAVLRRHEIRAATGGVIREIRKGRGDAVKEFETVVRIGPGPAQEG